MRILWDERKRLANIDKHGLDFASLDESFFDLAAIRPATRNRFVAYGRHDDRWVAVIFAAYGNEAISIISMRAASVAERRRAKWHET